ncbi:unnamed protein product [Paramecium pentaurelia]|uniref:Uncharacterized protein n=1 Tax=Paramecium pentaurelia TaxID=43138 RepID=A0A8S1WPC9_9CILI|nr:unnamed protein product [Paramecium pentaurelia]
MQFYNFDNENSLPQIYDDNENQGSELNYIFQSNQQSQQDQENLLSQNPILQTENSYNQQNFYQQLDQEQEPEICHQSQKSTIIARKKTKIRLKQPKKIYKEEPIAQECEKKESTQQSETKNLPKFYANSILNKLENLNTICQKQNPQIKKKIKKFDDKPSNLKTLREMLQDPIINKITIEFITSFDFLDQILGSGRLQDVKPPITYLNKLYQGCLNTDVLKQWK